MTDLEIAIGNIEARIRMILGSLGTPSSPDDSEGPLTNLSHLYRMRGIGRFLLEADVAAYGRDLQRSVQARAAYLQGCANGVPCSPRFFRTTRNRAFFDALAVNDVAAAADLADGCDGYWVERLEYEEDFLFVDYLQKAFLVHRGLRPAGARAATLGRYLRVLEDATESPHYRLCRALEDRDPASVEEALEAITTRRSDNYARLAAAGDLPQVMLQTERFLDVQGIAILRMAGELGLSMASREYPRIPAELVAVAFAQPQALPPHSWRRI